jgi:sulfhydrogenase subunit alpha
MSLIVIDHLVRVEGHGGITVEMDGDTVSDVRFDIFEGARLLEPLVVGRDYREVPAILSRICAICSVAHSLTSLKAIESAFEIRVSRQTEVLRDLMFYGESIESHALHLFLLAWPDYLGYPSATAMAVDKEPAVLLGLQFKKLGNLIQEAIGGRAIHPVNAIPGGFGRPPSIDQLLDLRAALVQGLADSRAVLDFASSLPATDFCAAPTAYAALAAPGAHSYYSGDQVVVTSDAGRTTVPAAEYRRLTNEKPVAHSHAKHSSFRDEPFMVGALARLTVAADDAPATIRAAARQLNLHFPSTNPMDNNKAQAVELLHDVRRALELVEGLLRTGVEDERPVAIQPRAGRGAAVTEAPRGLLVHSYRFDADGRVADADVITPTAMNAASLESHLRRTVEQCAERRESEITRRLQMVARAYDPCISCSVHLIRAK